MDINFRTLPRFADHSYKITMLVTEWAQAYAVPESAIIRQLAYAHGWISSNPRRAPKKDVVRFLFNWMRKAKQCGNLRVPGASQPRVAEAEPQLTETDLREMHEQKIKNLGRCVTRDCRFCQFPVAVNG